MAARARDARVSARTPAGDGSGPSQSVRNRKHSHQNEDPSFIEPCLATLRAKVPEGDEWIHEIKFDGYRAQAHLKNGGCVVYTRRGYDWTAAFQSVADAISKLGARHAILDGEVVVLNQTGRSDFHALQRELAQRRSDRLTYIAFDLLYLNGRDLRGTPLLERKRLLADLLKKAGDRIRFSDHLEAHGSSVMEHACAMHLEGIITKRKDAPYRSGRQESWLKIKCQKSEHFPIIAFVEKLGANPRRIASMYLGRYEDGQLLYAGKAQTGFTQQQLYDIRERLDPFIRKSTPLSIPVKKPKATWVEPVIEAEVQYSDVTSDGKLRAAVFKGLREDLLPDTASKAFRTRKRSTRGVPKENILQLLPDAVVPSKEELRAYWKKIAKRALPYLQRRPLKLVRSVSGTTFYHMGPLPSIPSEVGQLKVRKRQGGVGTRVWIEDLEGLLGLVDMDVIEVHPWNATVDDVEHADTMVFDLDPGNGISWDFVIESALTLKDVLAVEGLESWPKLTGGKGVHLMVPAQTRMTHDQAHRYCKAIAERLRKKHPARYTLSAKFHERRGRLFIDYLRNGRGTTAVGTYSPRARAGLPIATRVSWNQLASGIRPDAFTMNSPLRAT